MITRVTKAGALRSGGDSRGRIVHLVENPKGLGVNRLGYALCGTYPRIDWSDQALAHWPVCPKCAKRAAAIGGAA